MKDDHQLVIIAAYGDLDTAREDFGQLENRIKHGMELRAGSLVTKNADGQAEVTEVANKHGRAGALMGAGVGLLLGLVFEPLVLAVVAGGVSGALASVIADHELRSGVRKGVGDALENGTAVVLALAYPNGRGHVETALTRAHSFAELTFDKATMESIDEAVAAEIAKLPAADKPGTNS